MQHVVSARYLGIVFALVVTAGDGIVFWAPIFIHNMFDTDAPSGDILL